MTQNETAIKTALIGGISGAIAGAMISGAMSDGWAMADLVCGAFFPFIPSALMGIAFGDQGNKRGKNPFVFSIIGGILSAASVLIGLELMLKLFFSDFVWKALSLLGESLYD